MSFAPGWHGTDVINRENDARFGKNSCYPFGKSEETLQNEANQFPRRIDMSRMHPVELAILAALQEIEKVGASTGLTNAGIKLQEAKNLVSDFIDGKEEHSS